MNNEQILMCVVALILGMLLANMLKNICGCKLVEGQVAGALAGPMAPALRVGERGRRTQRQREGEPGSNNKYNFCWKNVDDCNHGLVMDNCYKICQDVVEKGGTAIYKKDEESTNTYIIPGEHCDHLTYLLDSAASSDHFWQHDEWRDYLNTYATERARCHRGH